MIEDKLTRDERIRLEALNQANQSFAMQRPNSVDLINRARELETYIRGPADAARQ